MTQKAAALPNPVLAWVTAHKAGNLEQTVQPAGGSTGWCGLSSASSESKPLPGSWPSGSLVLRF